MNSPLGKTFQEDWILKTNLIYVVQVLSSKKTDISG